MTQQHAERNLLYGILALQLDLISQDALLAAAAVWVKDKSRSLSEILIAQGSLAEDTDALLSPLVNKHLEIHDGDTARSLASVGQAHSELTLELRRLGDEDVSKSLMALTKGQEEAKPARPEPAPDPHVTQSYVADDSQISGDRFSIIRFHAQGGLGRVSVARDNELNREVALKRIQQRFADDPTCRARFVMEAELTGQLEHPGVVPIYGLGRYGDGRPYYAMRFIRGESLQDAIESFHRSGSGSWRRGDLRLRFCSLLAHFVDVCQTVEYAHSRGVLHRDIKPSNIMLGKFGETLVVDWGLARVSGAGERGVAISDEASLRITGSGDEAYTAMGDVVGTPAYASPEQAAGRMDLVGTASDTYSLGATFYCLLTGRPLFSGSDAQAVVEEVQRGRFRPPSDVDDRVPKALEAVCLKALARSPGDRYDSAAELAQEIERWLADEPVSARRETLVERGRRWIRNHQAAATGLASAAVVAMIALAVLAITLNSAKERESRLKVEAQNNKDVAESNFELARSAIDRMLTHVGYTWLRDVPYMTEIRQKLLEEAIAFNQQLLDIDQDDPDAQMQTAYSFRRLGDIYSMMDQTRQSTEAYERALEMTQSLVDRYPENADYRRQLGYLYGGLGRERQRSDQLDTAEDLFRQSCEIMNRVASADPESAVDEANSLRLLGRVLSIKGESEEAEEAFVESLAALEVEGELSLQGLRSRALSQYFLGLHFENGGRFEEAEGALRAAIGAQEQLTADDQVAGVDDRQDLINYLRSLSVLLLQSGRTNESEAISIRLIEEQRSIANRFPLILDYQTNLSSVITDLGVIYMRQGRLEQADTLLREGTAINERSLRLAPDVAFNKRVMGYDYLRLAELAYLRGDLEAERVSLERELQIRFELTEEFPENPAYRWEVALSATRRGALHRRTGEFEQATDLLNRAVQQSQELWRESPDQNMLIGILAMALRDRGELHALQGNWQEARSDFLQAMDVATEGAALSPDFMFHPRNVAEIQRARTWLRISESPDDGDGIRDQAAQARRSWDEVRERDPGNLKNTLVWIHAVLDQIEATVDHDPDTGLALIDFLRSEIQAAPETLSQYARARLAIARLETLDTRYTLTRQDLDAETRERLAEDGATAVSVIDTLLDDAGDELEFQRSWVAASIVYGVALDRIGREDEAQAVRQAARERLEGLRERFPAVAWWQPLSEQLEATDEPSR